MARQHLSLPTPRYVGKGLLKGERRFFEPKTLAPQEPPYGVVRHIHTVRGQLRLQSVSPGSVDAASQPTKRAAANRY
jgi:hypothetical protein